MKVKKRARDYKALNPRCEQVDDFMHALINNAVAHNGEPAVGVLITIFTTYHRERCPHCMDYNHAEH